MEDDQGRETPTATRTDDASNVRIRIYARVRPVKTLTPAICLDRDNGSIEIRVPKNVLKGYDLTDLYLNLRVG